MFKKVNVRQSLPKMEEEVLKYWEENKVFEKSVAKDAPKGDFVFYEGPPTANGKPGLHHVLARSFKDVIPRYKTMKGYRVKRKAGWDTHGLPVELQVEKKLGLRNKQDIENIVPGDRRASIIEFNKQCKESVWEYKDLWEKMTTRMGYWVDMEHPYVTYDNRYIESVWWQLAQIAELKDAKGRDMLYRGRKIVPYCYRCGTALSSHEVAQGYQAVKDNSVYVKFKVKPGQKIGDFTTDDKTYFLAWTTTPWTLPGNVALAVNKNILYIRVIADSYASYILAFDRKDDVLKEKEFLISDTIKGESLLGLHYESLYATASDNEQEDAFRIVAGDFVTTDSGTGIVHIAPAFGEDDANVGKENDLPTLMTVDEEGKVSVDVPGKGTPVKKKNEKNRYAVDDLIIKDLKARNLFFADELYEHEYPFCWRCDTPLIYYAKPSWFIRMSELADDLVKNNESIGWVPEHIKEGRFGEWLKGVKDWAISRDRFWGTPLPIWQCDKCDHTEVIDSINKLSELSEKKIDDVHKPYVDEITFSCKKCDGTMVRTPEVMDVWFDSGAMPLAQFHYPYGATDEDKKAIESGSYFPADYISEAIDQTRGWFYTLHAVATLLNKSGKVPVGNAYKNVVCLAHILDAQGKKMSKSRGNVIDPFEMFDQFGADSLRWLLFTINQPGIPKRFDIKGMRDVQNRVFRMLWNSYSFFVMYADIDGFEPVTNNKQLATKNILDKWILSELQMLIGVVDKSLDSYDAYNAGKAIEVFIDDLSNWYIRRSRKRFWKSEDDEDKNAAYQTLYTVLVTLAKLMAPFTPFIAEEIYRNLTGEESVHLADYPVADESVIDRELMEAMRMTRDLITEGLQLRAKEKIKVRQPLMEASLRAGQTLSIELIDILKDELNVKSVSFHDDQGAAIILDTVITPELKLEGQAREITRFIQETRKEAGFEVDDRIQVGYRGYEDVFAVPALRALIAREVLAEKGLHQGEVDGSDIHKETVIDDAKLSVWLKRA
ncbi:MAG: isoleucine--tRNA ligase [Candidatus Moranbacteria bacterium]|nr:isoleucine--tRNA ligase [Candidatus Moranbacteria bacterium]